MQYMRLLRALLDILLPPRDTEAVVRDATLAQLGAHVRTHTSAAGIVSLMPYRKELPRALVLEAKFRGNERAEYLLAGLLREYLESWIADTEAYEAHSAVLVPIPLAEERLRARGYNQAERIARRALQGLPGIELALVLTRTRDTLPQTTLSRARRLSNMDGAFRVVEPVRADHTYIVFDDVSTTGATLKAAQAALTEAGATRIVLLSLAH